MKKWIFLFLVLTLLSGCQSSKQPQLMARIPSSKQKMAKVKPFLQKQELIVIDAGHGGEDRGTCSLIPPKYQEKSLNLATAQCLREFLQKMGYQVRMTRSDDTFIPLPMRSLFANNYNPRLFVSVHYNAAPSEFAEGVEVYYYNSDENKKRTSHSKKLADLVLQRIIQKTGAKSRGVKHGNLAVIRETMMPAILVEGGFMTNKEEMEKIKNPVYMKQLSLGIALGIDDYIKTGSY